MQLNAGKSMVLCLLSKETAAGALTEKVKQIQQFGFIFSKSCICCIFTFPLNLKCELTVGDLEL